MWKCVGLVGLVALGAACESLPECRPGQVRYDGRPPRTLFAFDRTCRADCFSLPVATANEGRCDPDCPEVRLNNPDGGLFDDRTLILADAESLNRDGTTPVRALIYTFGYVDETGGNAPDGWGMTTVGPRTYLSDQTDGTARFVMEVGVFEVERSPDDPDLLVVTGTVSGSLGASPGRLEVLEASPGRIAGRFFLSWATPTEQPQGEVVGCFDLGLSEVRNDTYQVFQ